MAPAHLPDLKPQQPDAQSASELHWPVMNWVPCAEMRVARPRVRSEIVMRTMFAEMGIELLKDVFGVMSEIEGKVCDQHRKEYCYWKEWLLYDGVMAAYQRPS